MKTIRLLYPDFLAGGGISTYYFGSNLLSHIVPANENQPLVKVPLAAPDGKERSIKDGIYAKDEVISTIKSAMSAIKAAKPDKIITLGGNCMVSQAPFDYLHGLYKDLGIVWIDAHPDVSLPQNGYANAHAMVLASLLGRENVAFSALLENEPFRANELLYIGLQGLHEYQKQFLNQMNVAYKVQSESFISDDEIKGFLARFKHVLVHFDVDVLDERFFHSTYFANPALKGDGSGGGVMKMQKLSALLGLISANADIVGFSVAEYLPFDEEQLCAALGQVALFTQG